MTQLMPDERTLTPSTTSIDALAAPARDGELLVEPAADRLLENARANRALRREYDFNLLDRSASDWLASRVDPERPLVIMSGHQPEFFHPGVWIKHVLATRLAERLNGETHFLIVDSDVPVVIRLEWPVVHDGIASIDSARAASVMDWRSYEYIRDREGIDYAALFEAARQHYAGFEESSLEAFADAMTAPRERSVYVDRWIAGLAACDAALGVPAVKMTRISQCFDFASGEHDDAAAALVAHIIINAHEFRTAYNRALAGYRARRDIAGVQHPIPDLAENVLRIECPFWLTHPEHGRERLYATPCKKSDCVTLFAGGAPLADVRVSDLVAAPAAALSRALGPWGIRPRALAQTLYARIFACDLFLHGIGGAKYDQINDDLIRTFFGIDPPAYGAVSATLRLALPTFEASPIDLEHARRELRDVVYNPQRFADKRQRSELHTELAERTSAIADSDRLRSVDPSNKQARKATFDRIHAANRRIREKLSGLTEAKRDAVQQLTRELAHNRIAMSREWFFPLYNAGQLRALRDEAWQAIDAAPR